MSSCKLFSEEDIVAKYESDQKGYQMIVELLLDNSKANLVRVTPHFSYSEYLGGRGEHTKIIAGIYCQSEQPDILIEESDAIILKEFFQKSGIDVITIYRDDQCIEFYWDSLAMLSDQYLVYTKTGDETPYGWLWKKTSINENWYIGEIHNDPREGSLSWAP